MKKKLLILAVAGFALASCSNDETVASQVNSEANEISFRPLMTGVTRAADINATTLETSGFYVSARKHSDDSEYFTDAAFTVYTTPSSVKTWTCNTKYYWPSDDSELDFYAYSPKAVGDGYNTQITAHTAYKSFEITPATTASSQVDLIFANANQKKKSTDKTGVVLNFRHAESKVVIQLKNTNSSLTFTVGDVVIGNVKNKGQFTFTGETDNLLKYADWAWDGASNTSYSQTVASASAYSTSSPAQAGVDMILVPQTLTNATTYRNSDANAVFDGSFITVQLKIQNTVGGAYIVGGEASWQVALWPLPATVWNPGKKYTYTVDLAGGGYYPTNQSAIGTGSALDPILNDTEIKFVTVTVDEWNTTPGNTDVTMP